MAVSTFNTEAQDIIVYDPKNYSISSSTQTILAKLVNTDKPSFTVRMASVVKQSGCSDCGLFAVAYVTHLANNLNPSLCVFSQSKMRSHLMHCFEQKRLDPFPIVKEKRSSIAKVISIKVYCYCRSTYNGDKMVQCCGVCSEWYHTKCITTKIHRKWLCNNCIS